MEKSGGPPWNPELSTFPKSPAFWSKKLFQKRLRSLFVLVAEVLDECVGGETVDHQMNHGNLDHRGAGIGAFLTIIPERP